MLNFKNKFETYRTRFENLLENYFDNECNGIPEILKESMSYAIKDGGKRVRPVLCFATAEMLGVEIKNVEYYALAIEMIHSYSLVHDDLPAMDNDDYRRGKLSTHKKFGEAYGILAGDGLLNFAYETCLKKRDICEKDLRAIKLIAEHAGSKGMVGGQVLDLLNESNKNADSEDLFRIYENKTAKLIMAPILVSSIIAGDKYYSELSNYGYNLGLLFQIVDDIMDEEGSLESIGKTPHKDRLEDKLTSVRVFGLQGAKELAKEKYLNCCEFIKKIPGNEFLKCFTDMMYNRKN